MAENTITKELFEEVKNITPLTSIAFARKIQVLVALYRESGSQDDLLAAINAKDYFVAHFIDNKFGGVYQSVTADGERDDASKKTLSQAYAICALADFVKVVKDESVLSVAQNIYHTLEKNIWCEECGSYVKGRERDWSVPEKTCSGKGGCKSVQNAIYEAYTKLYEVWPHSILKCSIVKAFRAVVK